jgi:hypothetical protein
VGQTGSRWFYTHSRSKTKNTTKTPRHQEKLKTSSHAVLGDLGALVVKSVSFELKANRYEGPITDVQGVPGSPLAA